LLLAKVVSGKRSWHAGRVVHCASGGRSTKSLRVFQEQLFLAVYHLDGGIKAWQKAGLPLETNTK